MNVFASKLAHTPPAMRRDEREMNDREERQSVCGV